MEPGARREFAGTPPWVVQGLDAVASWLERDAASYDRSSDADMAEGKRELAEAIRGLAEGKGSDDLRKEAVKLLGTLKIPDHERIIAYLNGLSFRE